MLGRIQIGQGDAAALVGEQFCRLRALPRRCSRHHCNFPRDRAAKLGQPSGDEVGAELGQAPAAAVVVVASLDGAATAALMSEIQEEYAAAMNGMMFSANREAIANDFPGIFLPEEQPPPPPPRYGVVEVPAYNLARAFKRCKEASSFLDSSAAIDGMVSSQMLAADVPAAIKPFDVGKIAKAVGIEVYSRQQQTACKSACKALEKWSMDTASEIRSALTNRTEQESDMDPEIMERENYEGTRLQRMLRRLGMQMADILRDLTIDAFANFQSFLTDAGCAIVDVGGTPQSAIIVEYPCDVDKEEDPEAYEHAQRLLTAKHDASLFAVELCTSKNKVVLNQAAVDEADAKIKEWILANAPEEDDKHAKPLDMNECETKPVEPDVGFRFELSTNPVDFIEAQLTACNAVLEGLKGIPHVEMTTMQSLYWPSASQPKVAAVCGDGPFSDGDKKWADALLKSVKATMERKANLEHAIREQVQHRTGCVRMVLTRCMSS